VRARRTRDAEDASETVLINIAHLSGSAFPAVSPSLGERPGSGITETVPNSLKAAGTGGGKREAGLA